MESSKCVTTFNINNFHIGVSLYLMLCAPTIVSAAPSGSTTEGPKHTQLEEIIVTATKTGKTKLQETPITLTSLSGEELQRSNIKNFKDLTFLLPNVTVSQNAQSGQLYIRGVGTNNIFVGGDPSATIHVNGVYLARPVSLFNDLLEPERIEVLRGPQGSLYGRNSTGGTINVISKTPGEKFSARVSGELGSYNRTRASAFVNGTLWEGSPGKGTESSTVTSNLSLLASNRDGYVDNIHPAGSSELNEEDLKSARVALRITPADTLEFIIFADHFKRNESPPQYKATLKNTTGVEIGGAIKLDDFWTVNTPLKPRLDEEHNGIALTANWDIDERVHLSSISAYRTFNFFSQYDSDFTEVPSRISTLEEGQTQTSQEFQLKYQGESYSAVLGLFYFYDESTSDFNAQLLDRNPAQTSFVAGAVDTSASAFYTDLQWHLSEQWTLLLGGRYSREKKQIDSRFDFDTGTALLTTFDGSQEKTWNEFSPKLGVNYKLDSNGIVYGTVTQGFKSGGFNFTTGDNRFEPEELTSYELGIKLEILDSSLRLNGAIFYYDYTDLQVQQFEISVAGAPRAPIENASNAIIKGMELELLALLTPQWRVNASLSYLDATYEDYIAKRFAPNPTPPPPVVSADTDVSGNHLNSAPEYTASMISEYEHKLNELSLLYRLELRWQDEIFFTPFNESQTRQGAYGLVNASIVLQNENRDWELQVFGKNLGNKEYANASQDFSPLGVTLAINEPRTVGIKFSYWWE